MHICTSLAGYVTRGRCWKQPPLVYHGVMWVLQVQSMGTPVRWVAKMGIWAAHPSSSSVMASVVRAAGSTGRLSASSAYTLRARPRALNASACCSSSVQRPLHATSYGQQRIWKAVLCLVQNIWCTT